MRWLAALLLLTLPLAGCTEPAPPPAPANATDDGGIFIGQAPAPPPKPSAPGVYHNGTRQAGNATHNATSPGPSASPPPAASGGAAQPGAGNASTPAPSPPPPAGNATGGPVNGTAGGAANGTGNATAPGTNTTEPLPTPNQPVPTWAIGDLHSYHAVDRDRNGQYQDEFNQTRTVLSDNTTVAGVPVYFLRVDDDLGGQPSFDNVTRDGLNHINKTGYVTELYRFPLWVGKNWTYGFDTFLNGAESKLEGKVRVVGQEQVVVPAGEFPEAWKLHVDITQTAFGFTKQSHVDYWFDASVRDTVKTYEIRNDGTTQTMELVVADLK